MNVTPVQTTLFTSGESLNDFVMQHIPHIEDRAIVVITSKIVALAEGRFLKLAVEAEKEHYVRASSSWISRTKHVWLTVTQGRLMANAGMDESNAGGGVVLLPEDPFVSAENMRVFLAGRCKVKNIGVLIVDSATVPLRAGVTGAALGYAGFRGVRDYRGKVDLYGRPFVYSQVNVADCLASAAVVTMGEGDERQPLALITDAPVEFCATLSKEEVHISKNDDMYAPLLGDIL
jgi:dihydrofolate synthase / folylpolyglutamate synthase